MICRLTHILQKLNHSPEIMQFLHQSQSGDMYNLYIKVSEDKNRIKDNPEQFKMPLIEDDIRIKAEDYVNMQINVSFNQLSKITQGYKGIKVAQADNNAETSSLKFQLIKRNQSSIHQIQNIEQAKQKEPKLSENQNQGLRILQKLYYKKSIPYVVDVTHMEVWRELIWAQKLFGGRLFDVIIIDPPWNNFDENAVKGFKPSYHLLTDRQIFEIPFNKLQKNGFVIMWVVNGKMQTAMTEMLKLGHVQVILFILIIQFVVLLTNLFGQKQLKIKKQDQEMAMKQGTHLKRHIFLERGNIRQERKVLRSQMLLQHQLERHLKSLMNSMPMQKVSVLVDSCLKYLLRVTILEMGSCLLETKYDTIFFEFFNIKF
ncbi:MT-A70 family protein [Oxytricha trifallax]|uniref:MT-A70 family protein n=1 Tax=Oxytricha trifallax TaxID=1172189 RepID=A0A073HZZ2_9SPIT|nr:MT-A70 family protein [Oxytricha trifallax]